VIFTSQSGFTDPAREAQWDRWYLGHLELMASVPGISSAQRFKTTSPGYSPSLAMYSVASPEVFKDPYYLSVRGMGEWLPFIDRRWYTRNLFDGLERAPRVGEGERLLVADRGKPAAPGGVEWTWLECVALDRATAFRGIAVVPAAAEAGLKGDFAVYRPVTDVYTKAQGGKA
jgi:hypothetical protein